MGSQLRVHYPDTYTVQQYCSKELGLCEQIWPAVCVDCLIQWSYGVTAWEVMSLGLLPYAGMTNSEVVAFVQHDGRLDRPVTCPKEL